MQCYSAKFLASVVGQIVSLISVLGKQVCLRSRYLYKCILSKTSWKACVFVTPKAVDELKFWRMNAREINKLGKQVHKQEVFEVTVYTDASNTVVTVVFCILMKELSLVHPNV